MMAAQVPSAPPAQDEQIAIGTCIETTASVYKVEAFLGEGSFGKVVKCSKVGTDVIVAIKMIRNRGIYAMQAKQEVAALKKLRSLDPDSCNIVRWYKGFTNRGHVCLMFEHLDKSLFDLMEERDLQTFPLKDIRVIVQQIASALQHLRTVGIIHADLKPENVMLVNHAREPYRLKVIDFGLACEVSSAKVGSCIQTRPYRAPEVVLGLPFTEAVDMWSLGCMAAFMYLGCLLYPAMNQYDLMRYIVETQGMPPDHLLNSGRTTSRYFQRFHFASVWKLKRPELFHHETGIQPQETRSLKLRSLDDILRIWIVKHESSADRDTERRDRLMFVDMLKKMLQLDAAERITPRQVLEHNFTTMCPVSSQSCFDMLMCESVRGAVHESQQQAPSRTAQPVHHNPPPAAPTAASNSSVQPHCNDPRPCTSTQTMSRSGMKRKLDDEDGRAPPMSKRAKDELTDRQHSHAAPAVSTSQAGTSSRDHCNPSMAKAGTKRKLADEDTGCQSTTPDSRAEDRKRPRRTSPLPRTSHRSSWTQRSDHERQRDRNYPAGRSTSSRKQNSTPYVQSDRSRSPPKNHRDTTHTSSSTRHKQHAADEEDVPPRTRPDDNIRRRSAVWSEEDRRRRSYDDWRREERNLSRDSHGPRRESYQRPPCQP